MTERLIRSELQATQQTIKFFETLLHASADGILITDAAQNIIVANEAFSAPFGRRRRDVIETNLFVWLEQLDAGAPKRWAELEKRVRLQGSCQDVRFKLTPKTGARHLSVNASLLEQVANEERGVIISVWRDVTEQVQAKDALQKAHDELERRVEERTAELISANEKLRIRDWAMESSITAIVLVGLNGNLTYANPAFLKMWGYANAREVLRKPAANFWRMQESTLFEVTETLRDSGGRVGELVAQRKDGSSFDVQVSISLVTTRASIPICVMASFVDVSERVQAEKALEEYREHLEELVKARTAQLQSANKELRAFAYSVSHDLRAPLRAIGGFADIIARRHRKSLNEQGQHYFDNIVQASEQMNRLIDDLLAYSRLGRQTVRRQPVPLGDLLAQVTTILTERVVKTGAQISLPPPDTLPTLDSNWTLLNRVFTNLLDNALLYHRPGAPPRVAVSCQTEADRVIISISDNGIGIAPEFHEKIFNIFQRLHSQTDYAGTGIGLATVKKAVELLGGRISVDSAVGEGSTFYVELPLRPTDEQIAGSSDVEKGQKENG